MFGLTRNLPGRMCHWLLGASLSFSIATASAAPVVVPGTADLWLAGMPAGATASDGDVAPAQSPVEVLTEPIVPGSVLLFSASGEVRKGPSYPFFKPDGDGSEIGAKIQGSENGLSDLVAPKNALLGVFLGSTQPDQSPAPNRLIFITPQNLDYATLSPQLKQVFFIGDGLTSSGTRQRVIVPNGATRFFLGTMDGVGWYNNEGAFAVEVFLEAPTITIDDVSVLEGDSGTATASFVVQLSIASGRTVTVDYATADGTAIAGSDCISRSGTLSFSPGETVKTIDVTILSDSLFEPDETFFVNFRGSSNGINARNQGSGTIINDDVEHLPPVVSITSPANGAVFTLFTLLSVAAAASDSDGPVAKVEFFQDNIKLGEDVSGPYGVPWTNRQVGSHTLIARATDSLGLSSTSAPVTISVILPPNVPPEVRITQPADHAALNAHMDVRLKATAFDPDGLISQVEFYAGPRLLGVVESAPYSLIWSNVLASDYVLTVRARDDQGAFATNAVRVTVTPISADVAIVRDADDPEIVALQQYLAEIGLSSHPFSQTELSSETLRSFKLVIWDDWGRRPQGLAATTVGILHQAFTNGIPAYYIGENLASAALSLSEPFRALWTELVHLDPSGGKREAGPITLLGADFGHPILKGRFGIVDDFLYPESMESATASGSDTEVLGRAGAADVFVAFPDQNKPDSGGPRSVTQNFLVFHAGDDRSRAERKELFQNAVCWLLRCPMCSAMNLRVETTSSASQGRVGSPLTYEIAVFHSGECEATGVVVTDSLPSDVRFVGAATEQGDWRVQDGVVTFGLGRLPNGSRTTMSLTVIPTSAGELRNVVNVRVNGPEVSTDDNSSEMTIPVASGSLVLLSLGLSASGSPLLRLSAEAGRSFKIQASTNLVNWLDLTNAVVHGWTMPLLDLSPGGIKERFFRAVSP